GLMRANKVFLLVLSLLLNLGMLVYFKYSLDSELWCELTGKPFDPALIFLPAGISFFTFQSLSYTIDVYRGQLKALDSLLDYAFFVTFFPQMLAGPIVRAADFLPQIHQRLWVSREEFGRGVFLLCTGLFKKAVVSDYISVNFVDRVFDSPLQYSGAENLMAVYGYALQIYCDFSGYSDMAIGLALLMGFRFPINFDSPYQSLSITEFWRRWHISLSSWLRDYLYIPLGGNRRGTLGTWLVAVGFFLLSVVLWSMAGRQWWWIAVWGVAAVLIGVPAALGRTEQSAATGMNLMATMLLGGLWHGAASRFILWGALHGLALAAERWVKMLRPSAPGMLRRVLGGLWTFHFVCFCWVFFRAPGMEAAQQMLSQMVFQFHPEVLAEWVVGYAPVAFWMAVGFWLHWIPKSGEIWAQQAITRLPLLAKAALLVLVAVLVMQVKSAEVQPFIYFQF
ncbi:MAG TPA: MBOAT family O-acyltransferase, partial [Saprospiraceae bacterium]|nr:MBOAT family O-acyltransferase [Saprospiraceae bacterium]